MNEVILEAKDICKSFSGVKVLKNVNFCVRKGEVHALMGENGAGKSTLIKILTGAYTKDSGVIEWKGKQVEIHSLSDCQKLGMSCIYQELSVIPALTVSQNVFLGREPRVLGIIDHQKMRRMTQELIDRYGFPLDPDAVVSDLGIGVRQMVEILKGLSCKAEVLIMDEPTASLSGKEAETLFSIIERLRSEGVSVIYISHRLEEVYRLSDRLTILRDGKNEAVLDHDQIDPKRVISLMIGKEIDESAGSMNTMRKPSGEVLLHVENLTNNGNFRDVSFDIHKGEIVGFGGLIGAGRTEIMRAIYGIDSFTSGRITFDGQEFRSTPKKSIRAGIGFVPEDRRGQGFIPLLSTTYNIAITNYDIIKKNGLAIDEKDELDMSVRAIQMMDVRPNNPDKPVGLMSGGNQQKVVLGKWLMRDLKLLIVDEPTAGIDVGAKDEIYAILERLAQQGVAVILVSSDLQELIRVSHRILVMRKGSIIKEFNEGSVTQSMVLEAASGLVD